MFFFKTRSAARTFASKKGHYKVVDNGISTTRRWGVKVIKSNVLAIAA